MNRTDWKVFTIALLIIGVFITAAVTAAAVSVPKCARVVVTSAYEHQRNAISDSINVEVASHVKVASMTSSNIVDDVTNDLLTREQELENLDQHERAALAAASRVDSLSRWCQK